MSTLTYDANQIFYSDKKNVNFRLLGTWRFGVPGSNHFLRIKVIIDLGIVIYVGIHRDSHFRWTRTMNVNWKRSSG